MIFLKYFVLSLHVLMVFITALAPVLFYKRKGKCLMKFYLSMAGTAKARKIYRLQLEAWVFLVNLTYYLLNGPNTWQIPAHLQSSVGDYPKSLHSLNMKKGRSDTPLS